MRRIALALASLVVVAGCSSDPAPSASTTGPAPSPSGSATPTAAPSPSPTATPAGDTIPATITGMHVSGVQDGAWPDDNVPFGSLRLWDSGTAWSAVESTEGTYNWTLLDNAVANAEDHGVDDILLVLGSTPTWNAKKVTTGDYPVPGAASAPRDMDAWDDFVSAVAKRYAGRITSYQVWNEASLAMFWNGTPTQMAQLTKRAYDTIKAEDPDATVVAASTTVRLPGAFDRFFPRYLAALAKLDWPVDVFAAHMYPTSRGDTDDRAGFIDQVTQTLAEAGAPDLPIWDTELNYGLAGPGPSNPKQAIQGPAARDWVVETAFDSLARGISRTYWYIWTPEPYPLLGMQLTNDSGAAAGLRVVDQWLVGATSSGCTNSDGVTTCPVEKNAVPALIVWADDADTAIAAPAGFTQACTTDNECAEVDGPVAVTATPIRLLP